MAQCSAVTQRPPAVSSLVCSAVRTTPQSSQQTMESVKGQRAWPVLFKQVRFLEHRSDDMTEEFKSQKSKQKIYTWETLSIPLLAVPCIPTSVHANVECVSNTVRASWDQGAGALSYTGVLTGPGHYNESCLTSGLSCSFRGLTCAQTYTLNVISHDSQCNSLISPNISVTTGRKPQSISP